MILNGEENKMNRKNKDTPSINKNDTVKKKLEQNIIKAIQKEQGDKIRQMIKSMIPPKV